MISRLTAWMSDHLHAWRLERARRRVRSAYLAHLAARCDYDDAGPRAAFVGAGIERTARAWEAAELALSYAEETAAKGSHDEEGRQEPDPVCPSCSLTVPRAEFRTDDGICCKCLGLQVRSCYRNPFTGRFQ